MNDINVLDKFTKTFIQYIDSGFGLLGGEVGFLVSILIAIDITLAGLFWALSGEHDVIAKFIRKVLYVGFFALILNNFQVLADIIFQSFAGLGLEASQNNITPAQLLNPGFIAGKGFEAAHPLIVEAEKLVGFTSFFSNFPTIAVLIFAWFVVILAFFILAVQLFITIIEFKLTTLAGFVLVPFALWNKTAFLAERVLGNVISSGIKLMVLAIIIGIGSTIFDDFVTAFQGQEIDIENAMTLVLASIALFGLGIFGPGIAAGLVTGAPQLGAGAAVGTVGAVAAGSMLAGGAAAGAARAGGSVLSSGVKAAASVASGAGAAYGLARAASGAAGVAGVAAGAAGVARAGAGAAGQGARNLGRRATGGIRDAAQRGREAAWSATGGASSASGDASGPGSASGGSAAPQWANKLRSEQRMRTRAHMTSQAVKEGDRPGPGANPSLNDRDE